MSLIERSYYYSVILSVYTVGTYVYCEILDMLCTNFTLRCCVCAVCAVGAPWLGGECRGPRNPRLFRDRGSEGLLGEDLSSGILQTTPQR